MKTVLRVVSAMAMALLLSGCVIVPAGPGYYHPHRYYWGR
jgi:PBP1b-binding outer membrane lipoprotein LpoB